MQILEFKARSLVQKQRRPREEKRETVNLSDFYSVPRAHPGTQSKPPTKNK